MPTYTITAPNGKTYSIDGPPDATKSQVIEAILANYPDAGKLEADAGKSVEVAVDVRKASNDAILATVGLGFLCAVGLFLMIRHLWGKPRRTPHQLGFWWGTWASVLMFSSVATFNFHKGWVEFAYVTSLTVPVTFLTAYIVGWIVRRSSSIKSSDVELNELYARAMSEVEEGRADKGLWAKCFAQAGGDEAKAKAAYITHRVNG